MSAPEDEAVEAEIRVMDWARRLLIASIAMTLVSFFSSGVLLVIGWAIGAIPLVVLCLVARYASRRADEPLRGSVAYPLFVTAVVWWSTHTIAAALLLVGVLLCALPRRPWRLHVLGPLMVGAVLLTIVHPAERWMIPPLHMMFPGFWLLTLHTIGLTILVVKLCRLRAVGKSLR